MTYKVNTKTPSDFDHYQMIHARAYWHRRLDELSIRPNECASEYRALQWLSTQTREREWRRVRGIMRDLDEFYESLSMADVRPGLMSRLKRIIGAKNENTTQNNG